MITQAEYLTSIDEFKRIAKKREQLILDSTEGVATQQQLINQAKASLQGYENDVENFVLNTLRDSGNEAALYYSEKSGITLTNAERENLIDDLIYKQLKETYHGGTLEGRFSLIKRYVEYSVVKSAAVGKKIEDRRANVAGVLTEKFPFGAQIDKDKRLLLSEMVRLEQQVAKEYAYRGGIELIQWTLSDIHLISDACDDLANNIDRRVAHYIDVNDLPINPRGVYFADELPPLPHPNCQCNFNYPTAEVAPVGKALKRISKRLQKLWQKIRGK